MYLKAAAICLVDILIRELVKVSFVLAQLQNHMIFMTVEINLMLMCKVLDLGSLRQCICSHFCMVKSSNSKAIFINDIV